MTIYYSDIRVELDPECSDALSDGGRLQDVSIILTDKYPYGETQHPAGIALLACQARKLAFELLERAEQADRMRTHP